MSRSSSRTRKGHPNGSQQSMRRIALLQRSSRRLSDSSVSPYVESHTTFIDMHPQRMRQRRKGCVAAALSRQLPSVRRRLVQPLGSRRGGRVLPVLSGVSPEGAQSAAEEEVALKRKAVVNGRMHDEEALG